EFFELVGDQAAGNPAVNERDEHYDVFLCEQSLKIGVTRWPRTVALPIVECFGKQDVQLAHQVNVSRGQVQHGEVGTHRRTPYLDQPAPTPASGCHQRAVGFATSY